jgi:filamentous hemagglutinin family protein
VGGDLEISAPQGFRRSVSGGVRFTTLWYDRACLSGQTVLTHEGEVVAVYRWTHTQSGRLFWRASLLSALVLSMMFARCDAQVSTAITSDGTMGTVITDQGAVFNITGGTRPAQGPNLFHSFSQFDVGTGDTAHFVGQPGVDNIIGRVTGGRESLIDGRLQSDASLFLLNPSGLMFGPNATLDVHGSFHASTADALRFADGAAFSAHLNAKSTLTVASPAAFGFLNATPAGIEVQGSELSVPEGDTLSMVGGDIAIVGDGDPASDAPNLAAPGGQINLASVASSGDVGFNPVSERSELEVESFEQLGDMLIAEGGLVDVSGEGY